MCGEYSIAVSASDSFCGQRIVGLSIATRVARPALAVWPDAANDPARRLDEPFPNLDTPLPTLFESRADRSTRRLAAATLLFALALLAPLSVRADELQDVSKLVSSGKLDDAETRADAFLAKTPKDAQMRFLKGVIVAQRGKRDEAIAVFTGLTQDYPELPEPYNNLAVIYAAAGEYDKARGALETSVRVSPGYATAHENLGDVYAALAARSYQDARRYDATNAATQRKLTAARALLAGTPAAPAPAAATTPASAGGAATTADATRSQRNVGLPSPAGPRVSVGGTGATAPEIIVSADATQVPQGSNVVAIETSRADEERLATSTLAGAKTEVPAAVAVDPAQSIADVTVAVRRWAASRSVTMEGLRIRVDGDAAVARFRERSTRARKPVTVNRALTLRRNGAEWAVTDVRSEG